MIYSCPAWELAAYTHLLKLQRMQNNVLSSTANFSKTHTSPRFAHGLHLLHVYDYITKLCRRQAEVIQNHEHEYVRGIGQGEAIHKIYNWLKLAVLSSVRPFKSLSCR
jgi:hypothetical protein